MSFTGESWLCTCGQLGSKWLNDSNCWIIGIGINLVFPWNCGHQKSSVKRCWQIWKTIILLGAWPLFLRVYLRLGGILGGYIGLSKVVFLCCEHSLLPMSEAAHSLESLEINRLWYEFLGRSVGMVPKSLWKAWRLICFFSVRLVTEIRNRSDPIMVKLLKEIWNIAWDF